MALKPSMRINKTPLTQNGTILAENQEREGCTSREGRKIQGRMNMRIPRIALMVASLSAALSGRTNAQGTTNPDISVIPLFRIDTNDGSDLPAKRQFSTPQFNLEDFEVAIQGSLNPYARGDIFLTKSGLGSEPVEIKEGYATFLHGLPLDLNLKVGKYLEEFGNLNSLHPHAWPFVSKPLSLERFTGDEGINDLGIAASTLLLTGDVYSRLTVDVIKGTSIAGIDPAKGSLSGAAGLEDTVGSKVSYANSARLMALFTLDKFTDLEVGLSGLTGIHDPYHMLRFYYGNFDFKFKWRPSSSTSLTLQGEGLLNHRIIESTAGVQSAISTSGAYIFGDFQFEKTFSIGARLDWSQSPYSADDRAQGAAVFLGFYPVEETTALRLEYEFTQTQAPGSSKVSVNNIALQFMFSLGPHKAHPF